MGPDGRVHQSRIAPSQIAVRAKVHPLPGQQNGVVPGRRIGGGHSRGGASDEIPQVPQDDDAECHLLLPPPFDPRSRSQAQKKTAQLQEEWKEARARGGEELTGNDQSTSEKIIGKYTLHLPTAYLQLSPLVVGAIAFVLGPEAAQLLGYLLPVLAYERALVDKVDLAAAKGLDSLELQGGLSLASSRNVGPPLSHLLPGQGLLLSEVQL